MTASNAEELIRRIATGVRPVRVLQPPWRRTGSWLLLAAPLVATIGGILALVTGAPALGIALLVVAALLVAVTAVQCARTGRALGGLAVGLRTVSTRTGAAAGRSFLPALLRGQLETFDLRRGRDPYAPALAPVTFPEAQAILKAQWEELDRAMPPCLKL